MACFCLLRGYSFRPGISHPLNRMASTRSGQRAHASKLKGTLMKLVNRRSVFGFLLFASLSVFQPTSAVSVAQEPVAIEKTVPPTFLPPWACDWSVTCEDENGKITTTTGTAYGESKEEAEEAAGLEAELHFSVNCYSAPNPMSVGEGYQTSYNSLSSVGGSLNPPSPACNFATGEVWSVKYKCTSRNGGSIEKTSSGRTYCEALAKAREYVCKRINSRMARELF